MTNNSKIVILISAAAIFIVASINRPTASTRDLTPTQGTESPLQNMQHPLLLAQVASDEKPHAPVDSASAQKRVLKVIGDGLRSLENEDGATRAQLARAGQMAMESFLESWNPIEKTPHELKALFGKAKEENDDHLLYAFDNGNYAWLYQFEIRNGKVVELTRPLSE